MPRPVLNTATDKNILEMASTCISIYGLSKKIVIDETNTNYRLSFILLNKVHSN